MSVPYSGSGPQDLRAKAAEAEEALRSMVDPHCVEVVASSWRQLPEPAEEAVVMAEDGGQSAVRPLHGFTRYLVRATAVATGGRRATLQDASVEFPQPTALMRAPSRVSTYRDVVEAMAVRRLASDLRGGEEALSLALFDGSALAFLSRGVSGSDELEAALHRALGLLGLADAEELANQMEVLRAAGGYEVASPRVLLEAFRRSGGLGPRELELMALSVEAVEKASAVESALSSVLGSGALAAFMPKKSSSSTLCQPFFDTLVVQWLTRGPGYLYLGDTGLLGDRGPYVPEPWRSRLSGLTLSRAVVRLDGRGQAFMLEVVSREGGEEAVRRALSAALASGTYNGYPHMLAVAHRMAAVRRREARLYLGSLYGDDLRALVGVV